MEEKKKPLSLKETEEILGGKEVPGFKVKLEELNPLAMMALATKYSLYKQKENE